MRNWKVNFPDQNPKPELQTPLPLVLLIGTLAIWSLGYLFLFVAWRPLVGPIGANAVAMAIATLFNTAVHRELSHTADGQARRGRLYAVAGGLYAVSFALTTLGLLVAQLLFPGAHSFDLQPRQPRGTLATLSFPAAL